MTRLLCATCKEKLDWGLESEGTLPTFCWSESLKNNFERFSETRMWSSSSAFAQASAVLLR